MPASQQRRRVSCKRRFYTFFSTVSKASTHPTDGTPSVCTPPRGGTPPQTSWPSLWPCECCECVSVSNTAPTILGTTAIRGNSALNLLTPRSAAREGQRARGGAAAAAAAAAATVNMHSHGRSDSGDVPLLAIRTGDTPTDVRKRAFAATDTHGHHLTDEERRTMQSYESLGETDVVFVLFAAVCSGFPLCVTLV